ncbi:glycosyltransferase family 4 protein [Micromonospora sp. M12]
MWNGRGVHRLGAVGRVAGALRGRRCHAMPCRTRNRGLDVEGLGIVYLEASATGLPVVAGDSGGAPDAVHEGETGYVVRGRDVAQLADRVARLLADRTWPANWARRAGRGWSESGAGRHRRNGWRRCSPADRRSALPGGA